MRIFFVILSALATLANMAPLQAIDLPPAVTLAQAKSNYKKAIAETTIANTKDRAPLFGKYEAALERLQEQFQSQSEIEKAIAVEKEKERFATEKTTGDSKIPEIATFQKIFRESEIPFEENLTARLEDLRLRQIKVLSDLSASLTSLGENREAGDTAKELKRLGNATAATPVPADPPPPSREPLIAPPSRTIGQDNVNKGQNITKSASLKPDAYSLPKRITIKRPTSESKERVLLYALPGTVFRSSQFFAAKGCSIYADGVHFKDSKIFADLAGWLTARGSLFENCTLDKGGNWHSKAFNSKWRLENSVISGSFIPIIHSKRHGIEIRNCTFHRVHFEPFLYRDESDAGAEAVHRERTIDACRFVDCRIPLDLLICTTNCVFENCTFDEPSPLPLETPVAVTVYTHGKAPLYPSLGDKLSLSIEPATALPTPAGSNLQYDITGTSLSFANPPATAP